MLKLKDSGFRVYGIRCWVERKWGMEREREKACERESETPIVGEHLDAVLSAHRNTPRFQLLASGSPLPTLPRLELFHRKTF